MVFHPESLSGWGNIPDHSASVGYPNSVTELQEVVSTQTEILPRGLGRSYADQATLHNGHVLRMERMNRFLAFDDQSGYLVAQAGVSLAEIADVFVPRGWFLKITPGTKFVTLGGAIANDVHGKSHHVDGSFIQCVESFDLLLASGEVVTASRSSHPELFYANFGGLGLLGIILVVRLYLRKISSAYFRQRALSVPNLEAMLEAIETSDQEFSSSVAWVDPQARGKHLGRGVLTMGNLARLEELPAKLQANALKTGPKARITVPFYLPAFVLNGLTTRMLNVAIDYKQRSAPEFSHYESFFYPLDALNHWNRGYGKRGFIQYQFVIPIAGAAGNIRLILEKISHSGCTPFLNVLKKFGAPVAESVLSFPTHGFTFAIDFPIEPRLQPFTRELDELVLGMGGRIYLGKDAWLLPETFRAMYPRYSEWLAVKQRYDPQNRFTSDLAKRLRLGEP